MKKQLNTADITNELAGASAFFPRPTTPQDELPTKADAATHQPPSVQPQQPLDTPIEVTGSSQAETPVAAPLNKLTSTQTNRKASTLASYPNSVIETIRKAVKHPGREVTFVRLTPEEKRQLADIVYTYKRQGVKTSENEISRIAMSYLLEDYKATGNESILARVIASLLA